MYRPSLAPLLAPALAAALFTVLPISALAQDAASAFETIAPHVIVMDYETGTILYEKDARAPMAPASMTKIMTAGLVFEKLRDGSLSTETMFTVSEEAWRRGGAASGSSTMFLDLESEVSVGDLLKGVIIQSGNDACIVLAEGISGSETAFASAMTDRARDIGLETAVFKNSTGWPDAGHEISTYDLAQLAKHTISEYPEFYSLYAEPEFTWNEITQGNRNPLLGRFTGADGLKTGHTEASGYGLVASAKRGDERRIVVFNGLENKQQRRVESLRLMKAAFDQFKIYDLYKPGDVVGNVDVFMGLEASVPVVIDETIKVGLYQGDRKNLKAQLRYNGEAVAPIKAGDEIAELVITAPGRDEQVYALKAANDVKAKSALSKVWAVLLRKIRGE